MEISSIKFFYKDAFKRGATDCWPHNPFLSLRDVAAAFPRRSVGNRLDLILPSMEQYDNSYTIHTILTLFCTWYLINAFYRERVFYPPPLLSNFLTKSYGNIKFWHADWCLPKFFGKMVLG